MTDTVTASTLLLTLLMVVGLVFFIRASTKDRLETVTMVRSLEPLDLLKEITTYFEDRAYHVITVEALPQRIVLRGRVRPSLFLAGFLTLLAAVGTLCFALVLANLWPVYSPAFLGLLALAPAAGWFYWRSSDRDEDIVLEVRPDSDGTVGAPQARVSVTAHRDEIIALEQAFSP